MILKKYRFLIFVLCGLLYAGCSSATYVKSDDEVNNFSEIVEPINKRMAMLHFIDAAASEAKGDYAKAIIEYQDALALDPSAAIYYSIGKCYYYLNRLSLAVQNGKKAIELNNKRPEYFALLADIYSSARQPDSAVIMLNKVIELDSSNIDYYYRLARIQEINRPVQAIEIYNKILEKFGLEWNVLLRIAELSEKLGDLPSAVKAMEGMLEIDPSNISVQKVLIDYYTQGGFFDKALEISNDIIQLSPEDIETREKIAQIFIQQDDWKSAFDEYNIILKQPDVNFEAKIRIGLAYFFQSFKDSTILPLAKDFFLILDKDTVDWQVKMYLGAIALNEKDDVSAIKYFDEVTKLARWNVEAWIRLGGLYFDNQKYEESAKVMQEAIENFPDEYAVNFILGLALSQLDKHVEAEPYLKKSRDLNPDDVQTLSAYAYTLSKVNDPEEAIEMLKHALEIEPDNIGLLITLGLIYNSNKMFELSDSTYERALALDPTNALVNNNYAYSLSERGIQLERALKMVEISIEAEPTNSSYLDTIGWVYFKLGDYDKAEYYIKKAVEIGGERPVILEHLGDVIFKKGNKDYALELWQKAYELDNSNNELKQKIEKGEI